MAGGSLDGDVAVGSGWGVLAGSLLLFVSALYMSLSLVNSSASDSEPLLLSGVITIAGTKGLLG